MRCTLTFVLLEDACQTGYSWEGFHTSHNCDHFVVLYLMVQFEDTISKSD